MIGLLSPPPMKNLMVGGKKIPTGAAAAFIGDLYLNAGLEIPDEFNPIDETVRLVNALRAQGANHGREVDSESNQETGITA